MSIRAKYEQALLALLEAACDTADAMIRVLLAPWAYTAKGQYGFSTPFQRIATWARVRALKEFFGV